jgi:hypothetical protein
MILPLPHPKSECPNKHTKTQSCNRKRAYWLLTSINTPLSFLFFPSFLPSFIEKEERKQAPLNHPNLHLNAAAAAAAAGGGIRWIQK